METTCESCGVRAATMHDFRLRGGRWVEAEICGPCAQRRRTAIVPYVGAALALSAVFAGASIALERMNRGEGPGTPNAALDWTKRVRGATPTLAAYSRDLTADARAGKLDPVIGRESEIERVV